MAQWMDGAAEEMKARRGLLWDESGATSDGVERWLKRWGLSGLSGRRAGGCARKLGGTHSIRPRYLRSFIYARHVTLHSITWRATRVRPIRQTSFL